MAEHEHMTRESLIEAYRSLLGAYFSSCETMSDLPMTITLANGLIVPDPVFLESRKLLDETAGRLQQMRRALDEKQTQKQVCKHQDQQPEHTCPFEEEIHNDSEFMCTCCAECTQQCAYGI